MEQLRQFNAPASQDGQRDDSDCHNGELVRANDELRREVGEREHAEKALRESRERHRLQLENLPVGVFRIDSLEIGTFMLANRALVMMFGYESAEQLLQTNVAGVFEDAQECERLFGKVMARGQVTSEEVRLRRKDGVPLWGEITANVVRDQAGKAEYINGLVVDITERKLLETQLSQAQKLEAMGQLAAGIAHEINTPIQYVGDNTRFMQNGAATLIGLLETYDQLLKEADLPAEATDRYKAAAEEADLEYLVREIPAAVWQSLEGVDRVVGIVRAMKEFAHPGEDKKAPTDLNKLIESTLTLARNEWKYVAEMEMDFDPELPPVPLVPGDFKQVILNMVINAAHAIGEIIEELPEGRGAITVVTRYLGEWAEITISDTGAGIPEEARPRIFDLFFTTKPPGQGTGQGLAISRAVVIEKHAGTIKFDTEIGKGTVFVIRIPMAAPAPPREELAA